MLPLLYQLMTPTNAELLFDDDVFELVVDTLDEIITNSTLQSGGTKVLTEPLLLWCERYGGTIIERTVNGEIYCHLKLLSS